MISLFQAGSESKLIMARCITKKGVLISCMWKYGICKVDNGMRRKSEWRIGKEVSCSIFAQYGARMVPLSAYRETKGPNLRGKKIKKISGTVQCRKCTDIRNAVVDVLVTSYCVP